MVYKPLHTSSPLITEVLPRYPFGLLERLANVDAGVIDYFAGTSVMEPREVIRPFQR